MPGRWLKLGPSGLGATAAAEALLESGAGWPESLEANAEHIAKLATSNARENLFRTDSLVEKQWRFKQGTRNGIEREARSDRQYRRKYVRLVVGERLRG